MMRRFLLSLSFLLMSLAAFCTKYQIVKLSTPTIKIGSETCKKNSVFDSSAHIHWSEKKQGMWVRDLEKGDFYYFSAEAFLARKRKSAFEYIYSKKASTRDVGFSKVVSRTSADGEYEKRIALVIGNSNYSTEKTLSTPIPDAITVSESLADIGFNVYVVFDGDKEDMDEAIKKFVGYASGYETALVYYAGHGTQFNGDVFLMPVDAVVETSYDVKDRCVATGRVISFLNEVESLKTRLLFIDACRTENQLLASRGGNHEDFSTNELKDGIIVYSTKQGYKAYDDVAESFGHSPFATAFVDNVIKPVSINDFITDMMNEVKLLTNNPPYPYPQEPRPIQTLSRRFYFRGAEKASTNIISKMSVITPSGKDMTLDVDSSERGLNSLTPGYPEECYMEGMKYYKEAKYTEAVKFFMKASTKNYAPAWAMLGQCYLYGEGVDKDYSIAKDFFKKASKKGNLRAINGMGNMYFDGLGFEKNVTKAFAFYNEAAQKGYAGAQYNLGYIYYLGEGVDKDYKKAAYWFEKAAEQGNASAQSWLGACYYYGQGVEQDYKKAVYWYEKVAEKGEPVAQCYLGYCYDYGQGVEQDYKKAVYWYEKSANQGYANAQSCLGYCYEKGQGVEQDYKKAVYWYEKSANQGYANAQCNLGYCYKKGQGIEQDYKKAVYWYEKAANQGYANAQCNLGYCYEKGQGIEQDYKKAAYWYEKAANQGYARAQNNLGTCYAKGQGVEQDYKKAVLWYEKAANQGDADAQCNLGACYKNGEGVEQDYKKAVYWIEKAVEQGFDNAQNNLGTCYAKGQGVEQDYKKAAYWFEKAAEQGNTAAQHNIGQCYENGFGVEKNIEKAEYWYEKSKLKKK